MLAAVRADHGFLVVVLIEVATTQNAELVIRSIGLYEKLELLDVLCLVGLVGLVGFVGLVGHGVSLVSSKPVLTSQSRQRTSQLQLNGSAMDRTRRTGETRAFRLRAGTNRCIATWPDH